jgi:hypothetical protein
MRFGGHETFAIREGWLHKGLTLLIKQPDRLLDAYAADWLGVGRNMAKSIRHWLVASGLAKPMAIRSSGTPASLEATELGRLIATEDPYFSEGGTWWALHINLLHTPDYAMTWSWFFNHFNLSRFERAVCVEQLYRHLQLAERRMPSLTTVHRDVSCLLQSYARILPPESDDPEEGRECPFAELGLLSYFRTTGHYQLHQGAKPIPPHVLGYALSMAFPDARQGEGTIDIPLHEAVRQAGGPGKAFVLTSEALFEVVLRAESEAPAGDIQIAGLASERVVRLRRQPPLEWLRAYYAASAQKECYVAS